MSDRVTGTAAAAVGAHSKDAMQAAGAVPTPPQPDPAAWQDEEDSARPLHGTAERVLAAANDAGGSAVRTARRLGRRARVGSARAGRSASGAVQEYPLPALLMAGAAGLALGILLARRG